MCEMPRPSVLKLHVHFRHFGHAQVAQRTGCRFRGVTARVLPRLLTDADNVHDLVDRIDLLFRIVLGTDLPPLLVRDGILLGLICVRSRPSALRC